MKMRKEAKIMGGNVSEFVRLMRYWCDEGNLGYDQSNRWDIREGGECDCSSLVLFCLKEAGFDVGSAGYTGNMSANLTARGWRRIAPNGSPQVGDILLNDTNHVAVCTAPGMMSYASIDERGNISGGQAGDQTGRETRTVSEFYYRRGWDCYLRYVGAGESGAGADAGVDDSGSGELYSSTGFDGRGDEKVFMFGYVSRGKKGEAVKMCQAALNIRARAGLAVDGSCGPATDAAIRNWQRTHRLVVDGSCGSATWDSLLRE